MTGQTKPVEADREKWPGLSDKERERRWERVRQLMKSHDLDGLVVFGLKGREWLDRYLTNDATGGITIFPLSGELVYLSLYPGDLATHLESTLKGEACWVRDVRPGATGPRVVQILREKELDRARIGVVGVSLEGADKIGEGYVPYCTWTHISGNLPHANFCEMTRPFLDLVAVKSAEELVLVRRSAEIGELASERMLTVTRPGVGENEIYAAIMHEIFLNGSTGNVAPYATPLILHSGPDNPSWGAPRWLLRGQPPRVIRKGDLVQAEIFTRYGGMEGQVQMSVAVMPVDSINLECAAIARESYEAGLKTLRPGKTFGEVAEAMEEPIRKRGAWHSWPLIHSVNPFHWLGSMAVRMENLPGIERTRWDGPTPVFGADVVIQENTIWELEPNACLGRHRVNIGGTVIVEEDGVTELHALPTEMRVVK